MNRFPIRFERWLRVKGLHVSPQRIAAARRAIAADHERNALTPELVRPYNENPEARLAHFYDRYSSVAHRIRSHQAKCWREGRAMLRSMDDDTASICLALWNRGMYPLHGTYFIGHCRRCLDRPAEVREFLEFLTSRDHLHKKQLP